MLEISSLCFKLNYISLCLYIPQPHHFNSQTSPLQTHTHTHRHTHTHIHTRALTMLHEEDKKELHIHTYTHTPPRALTMLHEEDK